MNVNAEHLIAEQLERIYHHALKIYVKLASFELLKFSLK